MSRLTEYQTRAEWLEARRTGIGSSDAAAILRPYMTDQRELHGSPMSVWVSKLHPDCSTEEDDALPLVLGQHLQAGIARAYAELHGIEIDARIESEHYLERHDLMPWLIATPDYYTADGVAEIKHTAKRYQQEDPPPTAWVIQVQHQLAVTDRTHGTIVCLSAGRSLLAWRVERHQAWIEAWQMRAAEWWQRHVVAGVPPEADDTESTQRALRDAWPVQSEAEVVLDENAATWIVEAQEAQRAAAVQAPRERLAKNRIMRALGLAAVGRVPGFADPVTWRADKNGTRTLRLPKE